MSRIGKMSIPLPEGVKATMAGQTVSVEGKNGKLELEISSGLNVNIGEKEISCVLTEETPTQALRARHGLTRSLLANMVKGSSEGFTKELEIVGVGYRANVKDSNIELALGFSHPIIYPIPEGIKITVEKQTFIKISGANRQLVGRVAAEIKGYRRPEPYKGKGVKYRGEVIRRKAGKAAAGSTA